MASVTQYNSGTRTTAPVEANFTSLGTDPDTTAGHFSLFVDCSVMQAGDTLVVQLVEKTTSSSDTQRAVFSKTLTGAQSAEPEFASPVMPLLHGWAFQLKQSAGSSRAFKWSIRKSGA